MITDIYVLGSGPSLSLIDWDEFDHPEAITITQNGSINAYPQSDWQVVADFSALDAYHDCGYPEHTTWTGRKPMKSAAEKHGLTWISIEDLIYRGAPGQKGEYPWSGTGLDAILLAWYLHETIDTIQRIHYAGMDFTDTLDGERYAYCLSDFKHPKIKYVKDVELTKQNAKYSENTTYRKQLAMIIKLCKADPAFGAKLCCHSHFDILKGSGSAFDRGWRSAFRTTQEVREHVCGSH